MSSSGESSESGIGPAGSAQARVLFHVVLHEPEIPNNTGNIGRTCIAAACALHLIRPLGFDTGVKALRRAGLDYWPRLRVTEHESWDAYISAGAPAAPIDSSRLWLFTTKSARPLWDARLSSGDHLVFGKETRGLPEDLLARYPGRALALPMVPQERSLNLATAVCAAVYEGLRQCVARGEARLDAKGRIRL